MVNRSWILRICIEPRGLRGSFNSAYCCVRIPKNLTLDARSRGVKLRIYSANWMQYRCLFGWESQSENSATSFSKNIRKTALCVNINQILYSYSIAPVWVGTVNMGKATQLAQAYWRFMRVSSLIGVQASCCGSSK